MATRIRLRRGTTQGWANANPVLALAEPGYDYEAHILKLGDGSTPWNDLEGISGDFDLLPSAEGEPAGRTILTDGQGTFIIGDPPSSDDGDWDPFGGILHTSNVNLAEPHPFAEHVPAGARARLVGQWDPSENGMYEFPGPGGDGLLVPVPETQFASENIGRSVTYILVIAGQVVWFGAHEFHILSDDQGGYRLAYQTGIMIPAVTEVTGVDLSEPLTLGPQIPAGSPFIAHNTDGAGLQGDSGLYAHMGDGEVPRRWPIVAGSGCEVWTMRQRLTFVEAAHYGMGWVRKDGNYALRADTTDINILVTGDVDLDELEGMLPFAGPPAGTRLLIGVTSIVPNSMDFASSKFLAGGAVTRGEDEAEAGIYEWNGEDTLSFVGSAQGRAASVHITVDSETFTPTPLGLSGAFQEIDLGTGPNLMLALNSPSADHQYLPASDHQGVDAPVTVAEVVKKHAERISYVESRRWFTNVRLDHGAVGDGETDDTDAFEAAVAAVDEAGGGFLFVPAGDYLIRRPIRVPSRTTVFGEAGRSKVFRNKTIRAAFSEPVGNTNEVEVDDASGFAVGDAIHISESGNTGWDAHRAVITEINDNTITFTPNNTSGTFAGNNDSYVRTAFPLITNNGGSTENVHIRDLILDQNRDEDLDAILADTADFTIASLHFEAAFDSSVENVTFMRSISDAYSDQNRTATAFARNVLRGCTFLDSGRHAIHLGSRQAGSIVQGNYVDGAGDMCLFLCAESMENIIDGNVFRNAVFGVAGGDARDTSLDPVEGATDSTTDANLGGDIYNIVSNNQFKNISIAAVECGPRTVIDANIMIDVGSGVRVPVWSRDCVVSNNQITLATNSGGIGVRIGRGADGARVTGNSVVGKSNATVAGGYGCDWVSDVTFDNNSAKNLGNGFYIADPCARIKVTNLKLEGINSGFAPVRIYGETTDCSIDLSEVRTSQATTLVSFQEGVGEAAQVRLTFNGIGDNGSDNPASAGQWNAIGTGAVARRFDGVRVRWNDGDPHMSMFDQKSGGWVTLF